MFFPSEYVSLATKSKMANNDVTYFHQQPRQRPTETQLAPLPEFISPAENIENNNQVRTSLKNTACTIHSPNGTNALATRARCPNLADASFLTYVFLQSQTGKQRVLTRWGVQPTTRQRVRCISSGNKRPP
jgi:hypothetical protein